MADNVEITAGAGTRIATDEVTRNAIVEHQQIVKIGLGAEGSHDMVVDSGQQTMANSVPVVMASDQSLHPVVLGNIGTNLVKGGGAKTDTTDQSIMAAGGSGVFNYLCWIAVYNSSSTNTAVNVKDGSTIVAVIPLPAYGGAVFALPVPIRGTDNTAFNLAAVASVTTAQLYGGGYKGK